MQFVLAQVGSSILNVEIWGLILVLLALVAGGIWGFMVWLLGRLDGQQDRFITMVEKSTERITEPINDINHRVEGISNSVQALKELTIPTLKTLEFTATNHERRISVLEGHRNPHND